MESTGDRKSRNRQTSSPNLRNSSIPTDLFLKRESEIRRDRSDTSIDTSVSPDRRRKQSFGSNNSMGEDSFGVKSLSDTLDEAFPSLPRDVSPSTASTFSQDGTHESTAERPLEGSHLAGRKRKAGNRIHPTILATAQRIISGDQSSARSPSGSRHAYTPSSSSSSEPYRRIESDRSLDRSLSPLNLNSQPSDGLTGTPLSLIHI